jgi:hypothetical protein
MIFKVEEIQSSTLSDAVAGYIKAAIPAATMNLQAGELFGLPGGRWKSTGPGQFRRDDAVQVSWVGAIGRRAAQLHSLPEYRAVIDLVMAREEWRTQFGTLVGTRHSRARLDLDWFLDGCLDTALSANADGRDGAGAAIELAAKMEQLLDASDFVAEIVGPLFGFSAGVGRIELDPGLAIEPIDEAEVERLFSFGLLSPASPRFPFINAPSHFARATWRTPKFVGGVDEPPDIETLRNEPKPAEEAMEDLLVCLRLLKPGQVDLGGTVTVLPSHVGMSWHGPTGRTFLPRHFHTSYLLGGDEVDALVRLWKQLHARGVRMTRHVTLAARRFAYKGERSRVDDQLVDLIVAAEALFLADSDEEGRGELRFRLSSRAASYIRDASKSRRAVFRTFMAAYRMRSRLVHGGEARPVTLNGEQVSAERMVELIEDLLRIALRQALEEASQKPGRWTIDWESLLFPEVSTQG